MSEQEIKPCPYCGSADIKLHDEITHAVWCQECFAEVPSIDIESAIELWNSRPIEDDLRNCIAELEAYIDELENPQSIPDTCTCEDNPQDDRAGLYIDPDCPIHGEVNNE